MSEPVNPYREKLLQQLTEGVAGLLDNGYEQPYDQAVIDLGVDRAQVKMVMDMARRDRRWVLAWLLDRYRKQMTLHR